MASTATSLRFPRFFTIEKPSFVGPSWSSRPNNLILPRRSDIYSVVTFSRRRNSRPPSSTKLKKKGSRGRGAQDEEDLGEDALEALFQQLEEDLKNDSLSSNDVDDDDDIDEDDLAKLEQELEEALQDDELLGALESSGYTEEVRESEVEEDEGDGDGDYQNSYVDGDIDDEENMVKLKNWQLKRLAYALKNGRRKTSIKNLAADLCLDRAIVLELLRDPPPNLLMLSAALPDKPVSKVLEPMTETMEIVPVETAATNSKAEVEVKLPVHIMQTNWSAQKRIKKAQLETLELVYRRTKRPTNSMISSIVHVTHLPRKRVVKWFEDKRTEDGVPEHRIPYQRSGSTHS